MAEIGLFPSMLNTCYLNAFPVVMFAQRQSVLLNNNAIWLRIVMCLFAHLDSLVFASLSVYTGQRPNSFLCRRQQHFGPTVGIVIRQYHIIDL